MLTAWADSKPRLARAAWLVALFGSASCSGPGDRSDRAGSEPDAELAEGALYVGDADYRRRALEASLVNPDNAYSRLRRERYTESAWGALPEWNPRTSAMELGRVDAPVDSNAWSQLSIEQVPWQSEALLELGREAFFRYPIQAFAPARRVLELAGQAPRYGFWADGAVLGGMVWTEFPAGEVLPAFTCGACHASLESGRVVAGKNNAALDVEAAEFDSLSGSDHVTSSGREGRIDVTPDGLDNPTAIADLRAVRSQRHLHRAATIENGLIALAVRIETLIITSLAESARPPQKLAFALAWYLWNLEPEPQGAAPELAARGETLFAGECATCHTPPDFSGPRVSLDVVGTAPSVAESPDRFTGSYRVPSLRGVGDRRRLFANGVVFDVREVLDPARAAPGHAFGFGLAPDQREELLAYLSTL
jgi:mono/diheme cytochrome c family protein